MVYGTQITKKKIAMFIGTSRSTVRYQRAVLHAISRFHAHLLLLFCFAKSIYIIEHRRTYQDISCDIYTYHTLSGKKTNLKKYPFLPLTEFALLECLLTILIILKSWFGKFTAGPKNILRKNVFFLERNKLCVSSSPWL